MPKLGPLLLTRFSFVKGDIFTFFVGAEKVRYRVHAEALKAISEPLGYTMTNGHMEESMKSEAILPEVEREIFEQLVKFTYPGLCGALDGLVGGPAKSPLLKYTCHNCGVPCEYIVPSTTCPFWSASMSADLRELHETSQTTTQYQQL